MKTERRILAFFACLPIAICFLMGASYGVFSPGGALFGTWNSQSVNLGTGGFITGNLPVANLNAGSGASSTTYWSGAGTWTTPSGTLTLANPTGTVGLTAVNGVATTAPRSDSAPALSQAITPTWTGIHSFANTINTQMILPIADATYTVGSSSMRYVRVNAQTFGDGADTLLGSSGTQVQLANSATWNSVQILKPTTINGSLTVTSATMIASNTTFTNGAAAQIATMTNGPTAGNPTKWIPVNDNGTTRFIPAW